MANITKGTLYGLTTREVEAARMLATGQEFDVVARTLYAGTGIDELSESGRKVRMTKARKKLRAVLDNPNFQEMYKQILREYVMPSYGRAMLKIRDQIDDPNAWLANKAANDILTRFGTMVMGEESKEIVVKIEGLPTIGAPDPLDPVDDSPEASIEEAPFPYA